MTFFNINWLRIVVKNERRELIKDLNSFKKTMNILLKSQELMRLGVFVSNDLCIREDFIIFDVGMIYHRIGNGLCE